MWGCLGGDAIWNVTIGKAWATSRNVEGCSFHDTYLPGMLANGFSYHFQPDLGTERPSNNVVIFCSVLLWAVLISYMVMVKAPGWISAMLILCGYDLNPEGALWEGSGGPESSVCLSLVPWLGHLALSWSLWRGVKIKYRTHIKEWSKTSAWYLMHEILLWGFTARDSLKWGWSVLSYWQVSRHTDPVQNKVRWCNVRSGLPGRGCEGNWKGHQPCYWALILDANTKSTMPLRQGLGGCLAAFQYFLCYSWFSTSGSFSCQGTSWQCPERVSGVTTGALVGDGGCCYLDLVGRGQGCCCTSHNAQDSPLLPFKATNCPVQNVNSTKIYD